MTKAGSTSTDIPPPRWLLAELTYACPLQCPYCSNPLDYPRHAARELDTGAWLDVLRQGRELGALQLGFSGGEPLVRSDLEELIAEAAGLGYYSNLITSAVGMDRARLEGIVAAGLDSIQVSFQAATPALNDRLAGTAAFAHKRAMAEAAKAAGLPLTLNFVLHRRNLHEVGAMLALAQSLGADYVELANAQYYGWALVNRAQLLPDRAALERAEAEVARLREQPGAPTVYFVVPDYHADRPKGCGGGWGSTFINVAPDGTVLPCHAAWVIPDIERPSVRSESLREIWYESPLFNLYRGKQWMRPPCADCDERDHDFGGCRCQALLLTGDGAACDPVCAKSPQRAMIDAIIARDTTAAEAVLTARNSREARRLAMGAEP